mgnify:CR=1 FL=1
MFSVICCKELQASNQTMGLATGTMTFDASPSNVNTTSGKTNSTNFHLEWERFLDPNTSILLTYRLAIDSGTELIKYQSTNLIHRVYPLDAGTNFYSQDQKNIVTYKFSISPYLEYGGSLGRFLHDSIKLTGHLEKTVNFLGFNMGGGIYIHIARGFIIDFHLGTELGIGIKGTVDGFQSVNNYGLFALKLTL